VGACVGGAATIEATRQLLEKAGFEDIGIDVNDHSQELIQEWDPGNTEKAADYVVSAYIKAVKPTSST
jgi:2-methylcitrate dehydratase PrpD